ncbi:CLUMA_CG002586, isoform A [Clunio marinus]|uniref:CLUMA_CG002586, isoform A n=1 Tax=Clunio marinus TaxID=568069 RepID=A0A1J1HLJ0_9DIPT|nr:CLUMA_CG002586, isoform A [Clunio marinus]
MKKKKKLKYATQSHAQAKIELLFEGEGCQKQENPGFGGTLKLKVKMLQSASMQKRNSMSSLWNNCDG